MQEYIIIEKNFYQQFIKPGDLCFDIGANKGYKTYIFLELGARVVAVEPQTNCVYSIKKAFGHYPDLILINKAVGAKEGTAVMYINNRFDELTTLSDQWIKNMQESKRFGLSQWNKQVTVSLTTLDDLIAQYGIPKFCKIDTEGYEYQVLQGLSTPIPMLAFEFTTESMQDTLNCMQRLNQIGNYSYNLCVQHYKQMVLPEFVDAATISNILQQKSDIKYFWGDVYARLNYP